jgi:putative sigma-54 modulation protein
MRIIVTGRHVEVTPSLREFAAKKVSKLEEYFADLRQAHVVLSVEKYRHSAEIVFKAAGRDFSAKKTTKDMYASIEEAVQALARKEAKLKDRLHSQSARRRA